MIDKDVNWDEKTKLWNNLLNLLPNIIKENNKDKIKILDKKIKSEKLTQTRLKKYNKIFNL